MFLAQEPLHWKGQVRALQFLKFKILIKTRKYVDIVQYTSTTTRSARLRPRTTGQVGC